MSDRDDLVRRLRAIIEWVSERDHNRAIELDEVVAELEAFAQEPARTGREALDRIAEIVGWEQGTDPDTVVAYVAKLDGSRDLDHNTVRRRTEMLREASGAQDRATWPEMIERVRRMRDDDGAALRVGDRVGLRWLDPDGRGYRYAEGEVTPADGESKPVRITVRRGRPHHEFPPEG